MSDMQEFCGRIEQAAANREDVTLWGVDYVALPVDADGVPIHVGDTVWGCISGMQMAVRQLRLTDRWTISTDTGFVPKASAVTHVRHDSFERIADELDEMVDAADSADDRCEKLADLADRIRKLAKRED